MDQAKLQKKKKIVVLGFDALDPRRMERLMGQGLLPNFSRLKSEGSFSPLATTNPAQSPVAWTAFATGMNPGKNGIYDFIVRDPAHYRLSLSLSDTRGYKPKPVKKVPSFWDYASKKKIPSVILACPVTFPPDKIKGRMLSGMGVPDVMGTEGTFMYFTTADIGDGKDTGGKVFKVARTKEMSLDLLGPPQPSFKGVVDHMRVPFKLRIVNRETAKVTLSGRTVMLRRGVWSEWQEVAFDAGFFVKMHGIFKFRLIETEPDLKLFITPIGFDPRKPFFPVSHPPEYAAELASKIGLFRTQGMPFDTWGANEHRLDDEAFLEEAEEIFEERRQMFFFELERLREGLLFCYFEDADILQHMFWRYENPDSADSAPARYRTAIDDAYQKLDGVLGRTLEALGASDTLMVLSDHGFSSFRYAVHLNAWLREQGFLFLKDSKTGPGAELLKDVDWSRTRAYALSFGSIYLNLRGREGMGIVEPGGEAARITEEIAAGLRQWTDEKTGKRVIRTVYKSSEIFWGSEAEKTPDLGVGFHEGYRASWQTALGAVPERLIEDNLKKWSGDHLIDPELVPGVLFVNRKLRIPKPTLYDIAPTLLREFGYNDREILLTGMDGTFLF